MRKTRYKIFDFFDYKLVQYKLIKDKIYIHVHQQKQLCVYMCIFII
jgi:hypothetical protein